MKTKMTFKEHQEFQAADLAGKKLAAELLNTSPAELRITSKDVEEKVLDTGKEVKHKFLKMAIGSLVVRLFSAFGKLFARVESPTGNLVTFEVAGA